MKLTDAQTKALRLILDNPRGVVAWLRGETGFLKIHGNTEARLHTLGLVEVVKIGTSTRTVGAESIEYDVTVWSLTPAGYEALGVEAPAARERREELAAARLSVLAEASTGTQYRAEQIEENAELLLAEDGVEITAAAKWDHVRDHIADYAACTVDQDDAETLVALYEAVAALAEDELDAYRRGELDALPAETAARVRHDLGPCGEVLLPLPSRFRRAYAAELADIHHKADSAPYRQVWHHVTSGRTTVPRWLLGPLADVAALLADLDEESDVPGVFPATIRAARRRSAAELFALLAHHGARPWPRTGHGVRPWGDEPAHCDACAEHVGHRAPAAVVAVDTERADRQATKGTHPAADLDPLAPGKPFGCRSNEGSVDQAVSMSRSR